MRAQVLQCNDRRFLHHVAQIAGQGQFLALAACQRRFHKKDFATHGSPGQSRHHTGKLVALILVAAVVGCTQVFLQVFHLDAGGVGISACLVACHAAQHGGNFLLQLAHATLAGIVIDDFQEYLLAELDFVLLEAVVLQFLGDEVSLGDFQFFLGNVAVDFDDFHAVKEGTAHRCQTVGSGNEQNFGQVIVHIQVVVVEMAVLLGVKHLEKGR